MRLSNNVLTVLLITYNHDRWITKAIESILEQETDFSFIIKIFDDCSSDNTVEICKKYLEKYPNKIELIVNEGNIGPYKNKKNAFYSVNTKYCAFLEGDDYWCDKTKLQQQFDILEKYPKYSMCGHNTKYNFIKENNHISHDKPFFKIASGKISFKMIRQNYKKYYIKVHDNSRVYRMSSLKLNTLKNKMMVAEDSPSFFLAISSGPMYYIDKVMSVYNVTQEGIMTGASLSNQVFQSLKMNLTVNKFFDYKYNKLFINILQDYIKKLSFKQYFKLKYLTFSKKKLEKEYIKNIYQSKPIKLFAAVHKNNFGDVLNYFIWDKLNYNIYKKYETPDAPYECTFMYECNFLCIGSILDQYFFKNKRKINLENHDNVINVWGSGFISDFQTLHNTDNNWYVEEFWSKMKIHALRGFLSKARCEKLLNIKLDNIALGDPGLLLNKLVNYKNILKTCDVGIIPHYHDKDNINLQNIKLTKYKIKIIDISANVEEVINSIASCKIIFSSAMHGLIASDAFLIPNQWIELSDKVYGNGYKFLDYYSVFKNVKNPSPIDLKEKIITDKDIEQIINNYSITEKEVDDICNGLLKSFPEEFKYTLCE
jgi:glycosyltransferase involved in cell wall biosynthesis